MKKNYKITTIIPIYNVEDYLEDAIKSVIRQSIGFEENIELILINDGSPDDSERICKKYLEKYPNNIVYKKKKNGGVSSARNLGFKLAHGEYINFFDGDDIWDKNAYKKGIKMLDENPSIDLVAFRIKFFEKFTTYHHLDYKFTGNRIIDLKEEPSGIVLHIPTCIIRKNKLWNNPFDTNLKISEDTKVIYQILVDKQKYGIISDALYNYRRRMEETSAIQTSHLKKEWYLDTLKNCQLELIKIYEKKLGKVPQFLQYFIMYDLQWKIRHGLTDVLDEKEQKEYVELIEKLLTYVEDEVILDQKNIKTYYKMLTLLIKNKGNIKVTFKDEDVLVNNTNLCKISGIRNTIEILKIDNNTLYIDGRITHLSNDIKLFYKLKNSKDYIEINTYPRTKFNTSFSDKYIIKKEGYSLAIPLKKNDVLEFYFKYNNKYYQVTNTYIKHSRISNISKSYYIHDDFMITKGKGKINITKKPNKLGRIKKELRYWFGILYSKKKNKKLKVLSLIRIVFTRFIYFITKPCMPKNIWLFCDREFMGRDNAEALYKYTLSQENTDNRHCYFVIDKGYEDYERIKKYGKVIKYHTFKYKLFFLNAKYLISSHADGYINNACGAERSFFVDLYSFKYIYLTHGILLHDSSSWLNRINKDFTLNVVTSPLECKSILEGEYYFKEEQLIKSGLPRHDNLFIKEDEKNQILFMPSWRSKLAGPTIPGTQRREYNEEFTQSDYFKFYDKLFNDKKLQKVLKEHNLKIKFCIHPSFRAQFDDFKGNEYVDIAIDVDSQYETKVSKFIVTDYSSSACDFAYLRKPVVYANFDFDTIFETHYYNPGYFNYDKNGFGPNCKSYDETIDNIIKVIKNDCKMEEKYIKRCDEFFYHKDNKNCERAYKALMEYDKTHKN